MGGTAYAPVAVRPLGCASGIAQQLNMKCPLVIRGETDCPELAYRGDPRRVAYMALLSS